MGATKNRVVRCSAATSSPPSSIDQNLNPRVAALNPSQTVVLTDKARAMKQEGKPVIGLVAGEPDFDTPKQVIEAGIEALKIGKTRYTPNAGTAELLQAIVQKLKGRNDNINNNYNKYCSRDCVRKAVASTAA